MFYNLFPKFKVVEINNVAALRMGHVIAQTPAYVSGDGAIVTPTAVGTAKVIENGLIVGLDSSNRLANFDATKHSQPCLIYTEELVTGSVVEGLDQYANVVNYKDGEDYEYAYVRALPLNLGDTFTTNNVVKIEEGKTFAKVTNGRLELEASASADTMFIAKKTTLPAGQDAVEFTYIGKAMSPAPASN